MPDPPTCRDEMPSALDSHIISIEVCDGLRLDVDDARFGGTGIVRREVWIDAPAPEFWHIDGAGGTWQSQRYHDHDRFVFRGSEGYDGLTAVLTLAADGTVSGFVRGGEPAEADQ